MNGVWGGEVKVEVGEERVRERDADFILEDGMGTGLFFVFV